MKANQFLALAAIAVGSVFSSIAQTWTPTSAPATNWRSIVCSADGAKLAAVAGTNIYISTNSGTTWLTNGLPKFTFPPNFINQSVNFSGLASSADGSQLAGAAGNLGVIGVSTNSGAAWAYPTNYAEAAWVSIACSANGKTLALTEGGPTVHVSTNSGTSWYSLANLPNSGSAEQYAVMSTDGSFLGVAVQGKFFTTTNFGKDWVTNTPSTPFGQIAASADGRKLVTAPYGNYVYTSTNFGATWIQQTNSPNTLWWSVASSADGTKLAAVSGAASVGGAGVIYTSADSGVTWVSNNVPSQPWMQIASSADGNKLFAIVNGDDPVTAGGIWTLQTTPSPLLNLTPRNGGLAFSWLIPSTNFVLQQSSDLASWSDVTNAPVLNLTNLQNQVTLPLSSSNSFFRLKTP